MLIDPDQAHTVATVIDEGTLEAAARRLHLTPSAVSQRIKAIEDAVGQRLLVRTKPARATPAGLVIARYARQLALADAQAGQELGLGDDHRSVVTVAVNADSLAGWLLQPLTEFARDRGITLELRREDQDRTADLLDSGAAMAAVTTRSTPVAGCRVVELGAMGFEAVASPGWVDQWAPDGVTREALGRAPRIDYDRADRLQASWLATWDVDPDAAPRHLLPSTQAISLAVRAGLGWAVLPVEEAEAMIAAGDLVPLGGQHVHTVLYWQRWKVSVPVLDDLTDVVVRTARRRLA